MASLAGEGGDYYDCIKYLWDAKCVNGCLGYRQMFIAESDWVKCESVQIKKEWKPQFWHVKK